MASLSIRKLDEAVYQNLKSRAAMHGISMEEEVRHILSEVVSPNKAVHAIFRKNFGKKHGVDLAEPNKRKPHDPMDLSE